MERHAGATRLRSMIHAATVYDRYINAFVKLPIVDKLFSAFCERHHFIFLFFMFFSIYLQGYMQVVYEVVDEVVYGPSPGGGP